MDGLWDAYEKSLAQLRIMEMKNKQLEKNSIGDMMRIKFLNKEEEAKIKDRDDCSKRLTDLNNFYAALSEKLNELEGKLDYDNISNQQIDELNAFFRDAQSNNRALLNVEISRNRRKVPTQHSTS